MSTSTEPQTIPRVIHQIWYQGESAAPPQYRKYRESWLTKHPTWEHRFWDEAACRALLAERYPEYLPTWEAYPAMIQRIDSIRYFILDAHGGVYVDMDMECLRPLDPLLAGCDLLLSRTVGYNNAAFAGIPDHPLFRHARATLRAASPKPPRKKLLRLPGSAATPPPAAESSTNNMLTTTSGASFSDGRISVSRAAAASQPSRVARPGEAHHSQRK